MIKEKERKLDGVVLQMKQEKNALEDCIAQAFNTFYKQTSLSVCSVSVTKIKTLGGGLVHHCVQLEVTLD